MVGAEQLRLDEADAEGNHGEDVKAAAGQRTAAAR
jgi:hypothetical protein